MSKLFIANTKLQNHHFYYRLPTAWSESGKVTEWGELKSQEIAAGEQMPLANGKDLTEKECSAVIAHYGRYGMVRAGESAKGFRGLIYSIDKPIELGRIQESIEQTARAAADRSDQILTNTAAANLDKQMKLAQETGIRPPQRAELEVVEQPKKGDPSIAKGAEALAPGAEPKRRAA